MNNTLAVAVSPYEPNTLTESLEMAARLAKSGIIPSNLRGKPEDVWIVMATAREMGIGVMTALRSIAVFDGRAVVSSQLTVALCLRRPDICEYFRCVRTTEDEATFETKRVGSAATQETFTLKMADKAGLLGKDNWKKYPKAMLKRRAAMELARSEYPDLVGNVYDPEEVESLPYLERADSVQAIVEKVEAPPPPEPKPSPPKALEAVPNEELFTLSDALETVKTEADLKALAVTLGKLADGTVKEAMRARYVARAKQIREAAKAGAQ